jgi:hypothetical protein
MEKVKTWCWPYSHFNLLHNNVFMVTCYLGGFIFLFNLWLFDRISVTHILRVKPATEELSFVSIL